ncbi:MAG: hypothetical protein ACQEXJ_08145 [Myxococcota bacterium]
MLEALRRNSGLRVDAEGTFLYHGDRVPHPRVQDLFHRGLAVREDGDVTLTVGHMWAYVEVEAVARFVDHLEAGDGGLYVRTRIDEDVRRCPDPRLGFAPDGRFYLWEDEDTWPAVLTRKAHHELGALLDEDREGRPFLDLGGGEGLVIRQIDEAPGPADRW